MVHATIGLAGVEEAVYLLGLTLLYNHLGGHASGYVIGNLNDCFAFPTYSYVVTWMMMGHVGRWWPYIVLVLNSAYQWPALIENIVITLQVQDLKGQ